MKETQCLIAHIIQLIKRNRNMDKASHSYIKYQVYLKEAEKKINAILAELTQYEYDFNKLHQSNELAEIKYFETQQHSLIDPTIIKRKFKITQY